MTDFAQKIATQRDLTEEEQRKAGAAAAGTMGDEHTNFLKTIVQLIDSGDVNVDDPQSFLKQETYGTLDEGWKEKTDLALANIADLLRHIVDFYRSKETPDSSPQLQTMVEQLWEMKQRIEKHHDVFKF